jgi:hypothetical protein
MGNDPVALFGCMYVWGFFANIGYNVMKIYEKDKDQDCSLV